MSHIQTLAPQGVHKASKAPASKSDLLYYFVFSLFLGAMKVRQDTIKIQAENMEESANLQDAITKALGEIKYQKLPAGKVSQETVARVQNENNQISKERENLQDLLVSADQSSQIEYTGAKANVDLIESDAAENTGYLKTLYTVFKLINSLNSRSQ